MIIPFGPHQPDIATAAFIAPNATLIGQVSLGEGASVWYGAVLRADSGRIVIGARTNIQDNAVLHVNTRRDTILAADVTVGHAVVLEGCQIDAGALIGMNATVLSGAHVGAGSVVAAGAVVKEGMVIPAGMMAAGVPAKIIGPVSAAVQRRVAEAPTSYLAYAAKHRVALAT